MFEKRWMQMSNVAFYIVERPSSSTEVVEFKDNDLSKIEVILLRSKLRIYKLLQHKKICYPCDDVYIGVIYLRRGNHRRLRLLPICSIQDIRRCCARDRTQNEGPFVSFRRR